MFEIKNITCLDVQLLSEHEGEIDLSVGFTLPGQHELMDTNYRALNGLVLEFADANQGALASLALPVVKRYLDMRYGETDLESLDEAVWDEQVDYSVSFTNFGLTFRVDFCLNEGDDASSDT